ncbi:hypothetical protein LTR54_005053 [Friedmanniomyces endolithicus]|uniref:Alpha/beta hydrolase fold-3 domain-containing protein n=1 Tax=Friedmanniomyces endolithicus TaxID=329885 RepID=A0AAN6FYT9_9PEZI|nr:hypothetical protein LTR82_003695 [Friedmanniomyces endolithicus]KAK1011135.1 hypothetical protein LTR54_005053 [Friedmanniomyces endolithicus]
MILSQIAWIDCLAFLLFLAPQLLLHVNTIDLAICACKAIPHLRTTPLQTPLTYRNPLTTPLPVLTLPSRLIHERYLTPRAHQSPFVQHATLFQDLVIRCVRYAFTSIPAPIGAVFFSRPVALPFLRFRMLRHGYLRSPIYWRAINRKGLQGLFLIHDETRRPDVVVYYCHGGGFSMGSAYFYLEFLFAWVSLLKDAGYANPALFALEYTLVPEATYPTQLQEALKGYKYCLSIAEDPSRICVSGDSAGATLVLSLLLCLSNYAGGMRDKLPGLAIPISPWTVILNPNHRNTTSDYLDKDSLHLYGSQYIGTKARSDDPLVSPGSCKDLAWWRRASPTLGWFFVYGAEEVFAPDAKELVAVLKKGGIPVEVLKEKGWIHAWPVVKLFLCNSQEERQSGLRAMVKFMRERLKPGKDT